MQTQTPQEYADSLPTPSERLYAAAFGEYLRGRGPRPERPAAVRESRAAAIEATLQASVRCRRA